MCVYKSLVIIQGRGGFLFSPLPFEVSFNFCRLMQGWTHTHNTLVRWCRYSSVPDTELRQTWLFANTTWAAPLPPGDGCEELNNLYRRAIEQQGGVSNIKLVFWPLTVLNFNRWHSYKLLRLVWTTCECFCSEKRECSPLKRMKSDAGGWVGFLVGVFLMLLSLAFAFILISVYTPLKILPVFWLWCWHGPHGFHIKFILNCFGFAGS